MISTLIDISVKKFSESYSRVYFLENSTEGIFDSEGFSTKKYFFLKGFFFALFFLKRVFGKAFSKRF